MHGCLVLVLQHKQVRVLMALCCIGMALNLGVKLTVITVTQSHSTSHFLNVISSLIIQ